MKKKSNHKQLDDHESEHDTSSHRSKKHKVDDPHDRIRSKKPLTEAQRMKARENWGKLRAHIKQMKDKANFLVKFLDDENELKQEYIYGTDSNTRNKS